MFFAGRISLLAMFWFLRRNFRMGLSRIFPRCFNGRLERITPAVGQVGLIFCRNPGAYAYILESLKHYPAQRGVVDRMRTLGLENVRIHNILGGAMSINYGEKPKAL